MEPEKSLLKEFLNGGWLVPLVGAAAMFARLLSGQNELSIKQQLNHDSQVRFRADHGKTTIRMS